MCDSNSTFNDQAQFVQIADEALNAEMKLPRDFSDYKRLFLKARDLLEEGSKEIERLERKTSGLLGQLESAVRSNQLLRTRARDLQDELDRVRLQHALLVKSVESAVAS